MRKLIAAINITIDGNCDHRAGLPDEAIHEHYTQLLGNAGLILYGRKTYQLMQYWQSVLEQPTGEKAMDAFAWAIDKIPKLVFSRSLKETGWSTAAIATQDLETTVRQLKQENGGDILVGSPGMINVLTNLQLIDEWQICIHPVLAGPGRLLFEQLNTRLPLQLVHTKTFPAGHIILYYHSTQQ
ncbi:MAG: dihydrofolate reductase family protein [Bacteroidota bacterium]|nr:dihydrofolate reductase family protein [Bacteroidota bacterium]